MNMQFNDAIYERVMTNPLIDTHEHLIEENVRLGRTLNRKNFPCDDWSFILFHYLGDDFLSSGMPLDVHTRLFDPETGVAEKFTLLQPYWERTKHTGYGQAVRHTLRSLYGENDITSQSAPRISEKYFELVKPGFYDDIIRKRSNIPFCHVNSSEAIFLETKHADLLPQDLSILELSRCSHRDIIAAEQQSSHSARDLDGWLDIIDWYFASFGSRAIAVKNQLAYERSLDFDFVPQIRAERLFWRHVADRPLGPDELKELQNFLFRLCIQKATEHNLPVKLHTGYLAGCDHMQLGNIRNHFSDLCRLLSDFPETKFVLMHMGYPYQNELLALAKHYHNAYIDLCWAWILNPETCERFLREFIVSVPINKILAFGGDYVAVEMVYGHSQLARRGISLAISGLISAGWIELEETFPLIDRLMYANAIDLFKNSPEFIHKATG